MAVDFTGRAVELFKQAAAHDEAKKYDEAYRWYMESIEVFMTAIKYESKNKAKRDMLRKKVSEIMDRAESIKSYLDSKDDTTSGPNGGEGQAVRKAQAKNNDDDDKAKMRGGLESTIVREKPNVPWNAIAGLEGAKEALKEAVIMPVKFPQLFVGQLRPWRGILLYGPPGTGKSYLAKAVATESDGTFFSVSSADLMSRWLGDSEKLVRNLFEMAREANSSEGKPCIIFIDEIDSLCSTRSEGESDAMRRVKTEFLVQMQGVGHGGDGVLVLAATNIPWGLDSAVRRRFERRIYIPLPDVRARIAMFKIHLGDTPTEVGHADLTELAEATDGYSGSDISIVVRNALMENIRALQLATHFKYVPGPDPEDPNRTVDNRMVPCSPGDPGAFSMTAAKLDHPELVLSLPVTKMNFLRALQTARPSVSDQDLKQHIEFTEMFGQEG